VDNRYVIYTALFGNYDYLNDVGETDERCDYICFTDDRLLESKTWKVVYVKPHLSSSMMNRIIKILPHKYLEQYAASIYVDANVLIKKTPFFLFKNNLSTHDFWAYGHTVRDCIYSEGFACVKSRKTKCKPVIDQLGTYLREGFPRNYGLTANRVLIRNHNDEMVISLMDKWWFEMNNKTQRDQLSLFYVAWKNNYKISLAKSDSPFDNDYFKLMPHRGEKISFQYVFIRKLRSFLISLFCYPVFYMKIFRRIS